MNGDRCKGCGLVSAIAALLLAPVWLLCGLVLAGARLADLVSRRQARRREAAARIRAGGLRHLQRGCSEMSFSFSVRAATKAAAKEAVAAKFAEVVNSQPIHARDREAALANAGAAIDTLADEAMHVSVSVSGSVGWRDQLTEDADNPLTSVSISASAALVSPE